MEMFLMGLCVCVFGMGVAVLAFGAATRSESSDSAVQPVLPLVKAAAPARFFSDRAAVTPTVPPVALPRQVPIEVLHAFYHRTTVPTTPFFWWPERSTKRRR